MSRSIYKDQSNPPKVCPKCGGAGYVTTARIKCTHCRGHGTV